MKPKQLQEQVKTINKSILRTLYTIRTSVNNTITNQTGNKIQILKYTSITAPHSYRQKRILTENIQIRPKKQIYIITHMLLKYYLIIIVEPFCVKDSPSFIKMASFWLPQKSILPGVDVWEWNKWVRIGWKLLFKLHNLVWVNENYSVVSFLALIWKHLPTTHNSRIILKHFH